MKVTIDSRTAMKNAAEYVLNDLEYPPVEIELTEDPNDFLKIASNVAREYREEFIRCLEMEFNIRIAKASTEQLTKHGVDIIWKEDS
ncbi:hypothetical protein ER578_13220 [Enterococcus faecium]|uniref:DUF1351 domain-containing protein n=2 Tax=Enterococcus faecium TaxID=1352 RepID=A0AB73N796_ENTFC|nr:hypothetical protein [Enterococcus faecium]EGP5129989.1 hypothetical protein [Enterococcus faecium]EGP5710184.1 hypothetical protein [Enterococcus faecium]OTO00446.1 hypothetical protein A5804_001956 [Enterococcus faecium]OTO54119.1 hypothetical protein A5814_002241 [Enterococcus faecium]PQE66777.1 hypothetical protein CUS29_14260 [Enterococcus faecium]